MPYIVNNNGYSCRWVDMSENYELKINETFSDEYPVLQDQPQPVKTVAEKLAVIGITPEELKSELEK